MFGTKYGYKESDIAVNSNYSWTTAAEHDRAGNPYNFDIVMEHELGHASGLLHENRYVDTMNSNYPNGGSTQRTEEPHADARNGMRILYGTNTSLTDLVALRYNGGNSAKLNAVYQAGTSTGRAGLGDAVEIEYTLMNYSTTTQSVPVYFYISTDSYISSGDTYVGYTSWSMPAGSQVTAKKTIIIPSYLGVNRSYHFGYRIDPYNNIAEKSKLNNYDSNARTVYITQESTYVEPEPEPTPPPSRPFIDDLR